MELSKHRRRLSGNLFEDRTFTNEDVRNALADQAGFKKCKFKNCKFANASFAGATFLECEFEDCDFRGAVLTARIYDSKFVRCDLDQASFASAHVVASRFEVCRLQYCSFYRATVERTSFIDCSLHGAVLDFAVSSGLDFTGSNLWSAVIPLGCGFFLGNRFDRRQLHMLLSLLGRLECPDSVDTMARVREVVDGKTYRLVTRLIDGQEDDGNQK